MLAGEKPSAEFRRLQAAKANEKLSFPGTCASEKTLLSPQVCALKERARGGLHLLEKMLAFLRCVSRFLDTRRPAFRRNAGLVLPSGAARGDFPGGPGFGLRFGLIALLPTFPYFF